MDGFEQRVFLLRSYGEKLRNIGLAELILGILIFIGTLIFGASIFGIASSSQTEGELVTRFLSSLRIFFFFIIIIGIIRISIYYIVNNSLKNVNRDPDLVTPQGRRAATLLSSYVIVSVIALLAGSIMFINFLSGASQGTIATIDDLSQNLDSFASGGLWSEVINLIASVILVLVLSSIKDQLERLSWKFEQSHLLNEASGRIQNASLGALLIAIGQLIGLIPGENLSGWLTFPGYVVYIYYMIKGGNETMTFASRPLRPQEEASTRYLNSSVYPSSQPQKTAQPVGGAKTIQYCMQCGAENPISSKYCNACGEKL